MKSVPRFGRFACTAPHGAVADQVKFTGPDGAVHLRPVFSHQPAEFLYDRHGYESIVPVGETVLQARFTPDTIGGWRYVSLREGVPVEAGHFECQDSGHSGFIEISRHDSRYFATTDGASYLPIGLNLCWPPGFRLSAGAEFQSTSESGTFGLRAYARWFQQLAAHGGNFARLWLGAAYFQVETAVAGEHDLPRFCALDAVVELARAHGIRLKFCLEFFRTFDVKRPMHRALRHPVHGNPPPDMDTWFTDPEWQALWWRKVDALLARHGDDPVVMAWELWNEIDCCEVRDFAVARDWTERTLRAVKTAAPRNLVTNSLGSFDCEQKLVPQRAFQMEEMDFQQVHRYLDMGAGLPVCQTDPALASVDAIQRARRTDRPILLAETGAVNDTHTGPFPYYFWDNDGIIFHDVTYPPLFAGAAGSGHIWHWDEYVDQKNLLPGFAALTAAVEGIAFDQEQFVPEDWSTPECWCLVLKGRTCTLGWLRNKADRWDHVLRDGNIADAIRFPAIPDTCFGFSIENLGLFRPWPHDAPGTVTQLDGSFVLPDFRHGVIFRADRTIGPP